MGTLEDNAVVRALGTVERELNRTFDYYSIVQKRKKQYSKEKLKMPLSAMELHEMNGRPVYVGAPFNYWAIVDAKGDTEKTRSYLPLSKLKENLQGSFLHPACISFRIKKTNGAEVSNL